MARRNEVLGIDAGPTRLRPAHSTKTTERAATETTERATTERAATESATTDNGEDEPGESPPVVPRPHVVVGRILTALRRSLRHLAWMLAFTVPALVLWWHVWTGHPTSTLTCACGDPAQEVWFIAWPAWALWHGANLFFSNAVNVPNGANLLSNTAGTLIGLVLSPITRIWGPVAATNVALTLAPGLSAWGCWVAVRRVVTWKTAAIPAALVYGYSPAIVTSVMFGHASVALLVVPPLLFVHLFEMFARRQKSALHDGLVLFALVVVQFWISPEVLVICALFAALALLAVVVAVVVARRRRVPELLAQSRHGALSLLIAAGLSVAVLAYPVWFGLAGPQAVSGLLFPFAPIAGAVLWQFYSTAGARLPSITIVRVTGYLGHNGPQANFMGWGEGAVLAASVVLARRRRLAWLWIFLALAAAILSLGSIFLGPPALLRHIWLPWRVLAHLPVLDKILPDQLSWFVTLSVAFLIGLGLDAARARCARSFAWKRRTLRVVGSLLALGVGLVALVPVFLTYDVPLTVTATTLPRWMAHEAPALPNRTVLLTVPFAVSGSAAPMLWQAVDDMHFRLAGAALKTPDARGNPVAQGSKGSARGILSALTLGSNEPAGTPAQLATVRRALRTWQVDRVVIDGPSGDPVYASGFLTAVLGTAPDVVQGAWVWQVPSAVHMAPMITDASLAACQAVSKGSSALHRPLAMAHCVEAAGAAKT